MGITGVSRYKDLVEAVVDGIFYKGLGIILPYKTIPSQFRFETQSPNTLFGVYLNEIFTGEVRSDAVGNVIFDRLLPRGEVSITIINKVDGSKNFTYVTVRDWALWLSAYAQALEEIDSNLQEVQDDLSIETSTINGIEDHFGKAINVYNNINQSLDSYRWMINELRHAYRNMGSRYGGIETGVAAFTQVNPFGYTRRYWGPNWTLDQTMLVNHLYDSRSHLVYDLSAPVNITGVTLDKVEADVVSNPTTPHKIDYNFANNTLLWTPDGLAGVATEANSGSLFLPGPNHTKPAFVLGRDVSTIVYAVSASNNTLYFNIDDLGSISITLTTGLPNPTPAQVVSDINTAMSADVRYGVGYATFASVYNSKLLIKSPIAAGSKIIIEHGLNNGAPEIFGNDPGDLTFNPFPLNGIEILDLYGIFHAIGNGYFIDYSYTPGTPSIKKLRWRPNFSLSWSGWASITENGRYQINHGGTGTTLEVYCFFDEMPTSSNIISFNVGFLKLVENLIQNQGIWVTVDSNNLPLSNQTDNIKVYDDIDDGFIETPDNWSIDSITGFETSWIDTSDVINGKDNSYSPNQAFQWRITDSSTNTIQLTGRVNKFAMTWPGFRGRNYPPQGSGLFYDYEGFEAEFGVWIRNLTSSSATATLSFSFDNKSSWVSSGAIPITNDSGGLGYEDPTYVSFSTIIPAAITENGVYVRVQIDVVAGTINIALDSPSLGVKYISSRYMGNATVSRWRHNQYFGELIWCWSPDELSTKEKQYIGLQHKIPDRNVIYAGVVINSISYDTAAGIGSLDYEYNSSPDTRRLRWNSYNNAWGSGLGWVTIPSSGSYNLEDPTGAYITVDVSYDALSILSGSPPAQIITRSVDISDDTTVQGTIREISSAQSAIEIIDTTEFNGTVPVNLKGCIKEGDFIMSGATNLELSIASPFRFAYLYPNLESVTGENIIFNVVAPHFATLNYESDQNQITAILYENGIPVSNDSWFFINSNQIRIYDSIELPTALSPYNSASTYTINYGLLYQFTTPFIDLGGNYQDYMWLADYYLWDRMDSEEGTYPVISPVTFNAFNGRAYLTQKSTQDSSISKLYIQDGTDYREVPKRYWRFRDDLTIELDTSYIISGAQYYLEHEEARVYEVSNLNIVFEHRSGTNSTACSIASWNVISRNENVYVHGGHQVHQLRLSIGGVRDTRDFKIRDLVLKGLKLHGSTPSVVGLTNIWGW